MADFTFGCPSCKQGVQCDDAWSGHQIQCPICQASIVVPANTPPPPTRPSQQREVANLGHQLVAVPKGGSKLATAQSTQVARSSFGAGKRFERKEVKKKSPVVGIAIGLAVVVALGAGGYFAWPYVQEKLGKGNADSAGNAAAKPAQTAAAAPGADAAAAAPETPPAPPAPNTNAVIAPKWTLDAKKAEIPEGKLNGSIAGTNFVCESGRLDRSGTAAYVLTLRQGKGLTPDRGVAIYLRGGEIPTNRTFTASEDAGATGVSSVSKIWKTDPRYQAKTQSYSKGYAMKLDFGPMSESGTVSGKLYLALPDTEKSVLAGNFTVNTASTTAQPGYDAAAQAQPTQVEGAMDAAARQRFQQRYGIKR